MTALCQYDSLMSYNERPGNAQAAGRRKEKRHQVEIQHYSPLVGMFRELTQALAAANGVAERLLAPEGQTLARWTFLDTLSEGPISVPAVARRLRQTRQSTQRIADILVEEGHLLRLPNPDHRRSPLYACTASGREVLERLPDAVAEWYSFLGTALSLDQIERLTELSRSLRLAAEEFTEARLSREAALTGN
ncbi:MarR family winged helix-turn-helix transcriptional regulator [Pseudarthrobacter sp. AG30]|uniref:MarR family winged helix-turn-helix transcriptional regulator n=1 Tax=Pseudarthrobacter sp. AG30 TaxID=2249742 RepID=UPI001402628B|nr:MarR family transcriptional regulator [Pseudarthrobacter sp. AG30]